MSTIMQYVRLRAAELAKLRELVVTDRDGAYDYVDELADDDEARSIDTDRAWAAIGYLLERAGPPWVDPVRGGDELTADEWGFGPPRCLTPEQVASAARFLTSTPFTDLAPHLDAASMADIYPGIWAEDWAAGYVARFYEPLVGFFAAAAADGDAVVVYLS